ncbi:hypothetical protein [Sphingosinicella sp. CPCC 101087]|uniref:hypothetical protein n=1 Tax=Sphingosinicella sp. CPCC 101087 TaxID=2497754 RepID=UPI00101DF1C7|nr:hypothetical protein [Sphingosinicella sp. CPCC 101087]
MDQRKADVIEAGRWLLERRAELGASSMLVARMATLLANRQGDPVKIHQQQISDIENARPDKGPRSLRPWFRYVRAAFDSGLIADALGKATGEGEGPGEETYYIHSASGEVVGRLTWFARALK